MQNIEYEDLDLYEVLLSSKNDENHETGQIQAKGPSGEGWKPEAETLSRLLIVAEGPN